MGSPGACVECGADAYIRLGTSADADLVCARCFPRRFNRAAKKGGETTKPEDHPPRPPSPDTPRAA